METNERRSFALVELRVERDDDDEAVKITGHAAVFNKLSEDLGGFREKIAPGAFKDALDADVRALWNHDRSVVLGRTKSGTLRLKEDKVGLQVEIDPPDTQAARDLITLMERGDVDQMSFGFRTVDDVWEKVDGENIRTLKKVELIDVSPVTFPAYPQTDVAVRGFQEWQQAEAATAGLGLDLAKRKLALQWSAD